MAGLSQSYQRPAAVPRGDANYARNSLCRSPWPSRRSRLCGRCSVIWIGDAGHPRLAIDGGPALFERIELATWEVPSVRAPGARSPGLVARVAILRLGSA